MAQKKTAKKKRAGGKTYQITFQPKRKETHTEYLRLSKAIRERGFDIGRIVPEFLIEKLQAEEAAGFEGLKKYI